LVMPALRWSSFFMSERAVDHFGMTLVAKFD
jgi:hypothetical protein